MAKRESKGQQVKTFKAWVPDPTLQMAETQAKVYFQAADGTFTIWLPTHIGQTMPALPIYKQERRWHDILLYPARQAASQYDPGATSGHISGKVMDTVIDAYKVVLSQYVELLKTQQREKVIQFTYASNLRWQGEGTEYVFSQGQAVHSNDISFIGSPALHLTYAVLYRVKDTLYHLDDEGTENERLRYAAAVSDRGGRDGRTSVIPWTQEREDFLHRLKTNLERLILGVREFSRDLEGNIELAIAGKGSMALLAGPKPHLVTTGPDGEMMIGPTQIIDLDAVDLSDALEGRTPAEQPVRVRTRTRS